MKQIFTFILALSLFANANAQEQQIDPKEAEKIQALEVAFISRKLELTTSEAQKFWPVYNDYKKEIRDVQISQHKNPNKDIVETEQKIIDVRKRYRDRFAGVIGQPRVNRFFQAEGEFRRVLLNQLKNRPNRPMLQRRNRK
ncbi:MAG: hypothetical protein ACKVOM_04825 [Ferruginibacter sp.]